MRSTEQLLGMSTEALRDQLGNHHTEMFLANENLAQLRKQRKSLATPVAAEKSKKKKDKKEKKNKKGKSSQSLSDKQLQKNYLESQPKISLQQIKQNIAELKRYVLNQQLSITRINAIIDAKEFFAPAQPEVVEAIVYRHICGEYREFLDSLTAYQAANANNVLIEAANELKAYYENDSSEEAKKYLQAAKNILDDNSPAHRKALTELITDDFNDAAGKWTKPIAIATILLGAACVIAGVALFPVAILIPTLFPLIAAAVGLVPIGAGLISAGQSNLTFMANRISIHETQTRYINRFSVAANSLFAPAAASATDQAAPATTARIQP